MKIVEVIAEILKREGVEYLPCYPTTPLIDACAALGIKPIICRQERVGVGIADGFVRVTNGKKIGVFAMQYGPGAENAFPGIATAYSDSTPLLVLPLGHTKSRAQVFPQFSSYRNYALVTKWTEVLNVSSEVPEVMRRAFSLLKMGRLGPVLVEIPEDMATEEFKLPSVNYKPARSTTSAGNSDDVAKATLALVKAERPVIFAGQGVLYAEASKELVELAELLQVPVMTTLEGKSAFPEDHRLSLGTAASVTTGPVFHFMKNADLVFAIGTSLTRHPFSLTIPSGKVIIHATNDERDLNKNYDADYPILGDAKLVLRQFIEALKRSPEAASKNGGSSTVRQIQEVRDEWMKKWLPKLTSREIPINPYRVIWEFMRVVNPSEAIVTHDSGSPRNQLVPFYRATLPRSYLGWGKSHALGTGLGLIIGAKLAAPDKFCVNFMGDAAFGMTGLDFETAVRSKIPITTIVLNNSTMAMEKELLVISHDLYRTRDVSGRYADIGKALGGYAERIEDPEEIGSAIDRARKANQDGRAALLEFITSEETSNSYPRPF